MKYLQEFADETLVKEGIEKIRSLIKHPWKIMEVCGGQTHSFVKYGLLDLLPKTLQLIHGPGCPVCVTPSSIIDLAVELAQQPQFILCSFGDMLRVPGTTMSLLEAKSRGADVRILYSPLEAIKIAKENPLKEVVFFAVGFETTAPANGLSVKQAHREGVKNYSLLSAHVLVPPAMEAILNDSEAKVDGFLAAGHVCTIMGYDDYEPIAYNYHVPIVVSGFEPLDLIHGLYRTIYLLENKSNIVENAYARVVTKAGNRTAQALLLEVFEPCDRYWRGIGLIPNSGLKINKTYQEYDAFHKFSLQIESAKENTECIAGDILKGIKKPFDCKHFGKKCTPLFPLGAPMVSNEGACAAYYNYAKI
ncbi:MAG: hydrogenase formation protein HypD [Alphaproteobacteria bacterium]|nr:hydrogenase formation protein HypD [Alphaproteobacteria bacterium]